MRVLKIIKSFCADAFSKLFFVGLLGLPFFLLNCYPPYNNAPINQASQQPVNTQSYNQQTYSRQNQQPQINYVVGQTSDNNQDLQPPEDIRSSSRERRGTGCEAERASHSCYELCREMYSRDRDECLEEEVDTIDDIYEVYLSLKGANSLDRIDIEDFETYMEVSTFGFNSLLRDYNRVEAEDTLIWIAEDEKVAEIFLSEDRDFRILTNLLATMGRFSYDKVAVPFTRKIDRDNLIDYALSSGNGQALDYFFEFILESSTQCKKSSNVPNNCLQLMCEIAKATRNERDREFFYQDSRVFEDFITDIIDEGVNSKAKGGRWGKGAGSNQINDVNDLDYTWAGEKWDPTDGKKSLCATT